MRYHQTSEAFSRVPSLRQFSRSRTLRLARRDPEARSRISKASRSEPTETRPEAKDQGFGFGPRFKCPFELESLLADFARQFGIGETLSNDAPNEIAKSLRVLHWFP